MKIAIEKVRVGSKIYFAEGALEGDYKSINKAKRASREWQSRAGKMGDGRLRVALKAPQQVEAA